MKVQNVENGRVGEELDILEGRRGARVVKARVSGGVEHVIQVP